MEWLPYLCSRRSVLCLLQLLLFGLRRLAMITSQAVQDSKQATARPRWSKSQVRNQLMLSCDFGPPLVQSAANLLSYIWFIQLRNAMGIAGELPLAVSHACRFHPMNKPSLSSPSPPVSLSAWMSPHTVLLALLPGDIYPLWSGKPVLCTCRTDNPTIPYTYLQAVTDFTAIVIFGLLGYTILA